MDVENGHGLGCLIQTFVVIAGATKLHSLIAQIVNLLLLLWRQIAIGGQGCIDLGNIILALAGHGWGGKRHKERRAQAKFYSW